MKKSEEQLLREYDELIDRVEDAAVTPVWELADWLLENVPSLVGGRGKKGQLELPVSLDELAERRGVSRTWLKDMRATAGHFPPGVRLPGVSLRTHKAAWEKAKGDLDKALAALRNGGKLRDQGPAMESLDTMKRNLAARSPEERTDLATNLVEDPTVAKGVIKTSPKARGNLRKAEDDTKTEEWLEQAEKERREREAAGEPSMDDQLGMDSGELAEQMIENTMNERLDKAIHSISSAYLHMGVKGFHLIRRDDLRAERYRRDLIEAAQRLAELMDALDTYIEEVASRETA